MKFDAEFWDKTWSRPYGRYNRHHKEIWEAVVPYLKGKIIDLGCGTALMYQGQDVDLTGIDWSKEGIANAKNNYPKGNFLVGDIRNTGFPDKHFDSCVLAGILDYFENWDEVLSEARRITKGDIVATLLNGFEGHQWWGIGQTNKVIKEVGNWVIIRIENG